MATLVVRQLDDDLVRRLKERAAAHGSSAEAEHRAILDEVLRPRPRTGAEIAAALRGREPYFTDEELGAFEELDQPAEPVALPPRAGR
jgi:plasmid stability protein